MAKQGRLTAFLVLVFISTYTLSAPKKHIRIALGEWPPYASENLPHKGLLPLILKRAFAYSNTHVTFEFMSWDEAYNKTLNKEYDLSPGWIKTPSRAKDMRFSDAMSYIDLRFFHHSDTNFSWDTLEETYSLKLGTVSGYSYGSQLDTAIKNKRIRTRQYDSDRKALNGIAKNEIDLYPADALVATYIRNKLPSLIKNKISLDEHTISNSPIFLIGQPGSTAELINTFNAGLEQLRKSGEYAKILENFHLVNKLGRLNFYTEDNAPINYDGENGPSGIMVSSVKTLLSELGADLSQVNIQILPWARAYQNLENQNNTVLFAVTKTKERANKFKWVGPVYRSNIVLLGLKEKFTEPVILQELLEESVCAVNDDVGAQLWKKVSHNTHNLHVVSHPSQCAKMLSLGRVNLWATGKDTARWHIQKNNLKLETFKEVHQLKEAFRFIAFSKDVDTEIINNLQKALSYLQLSGRLSELIDAELIKADKFAQQADHDS